MSLQEEVEKRSWGIRNTVGIVENIEEQPENVVNADERKNESGSFRHVMMPFIYRK